MSKYTEEQWAQYAEMEEALYDVAGTWVEHFGEGGVTGAQMDGDRIEIHTEDNWAYGGHSEDYHSIPAWYLWTDGWLEKELADREKIKQAKEAEEAKLKAKRDEEAEIAERAKYLKLHKKYGEQS